MSLIYWDSMIFAYALEKSPAFFPVVKAVHDAMKRRGDTLCTSVFAVGEILVGPRKLGSQSGAERVKEFFASGTVEVLPFTLETAEQFAMVRTWTGARPPDAIHLATAALAHVDVFLTNDKKLLPLRVPGIVTISDLNPERLSRLLP